MDFGLWTRSVVASLIEEKFKVRLGLTAVGELLARLGLTPQKPLQRAYQRDPEAIEKWQRETFPAIAKLAKKQAGEVYFWDKSGFRADTVHGKTWALKGQTPVIERPGQRQTISAASAVNSAGAFWYCTYEGGLNAELFVVLLKRMMRGRRKPVHLVVDGLPAHKTILVKNYVASTNGMLTLHFLPGYAPDLNPDELVWSHMKRTGVARTPLRKGEKLAEKIEAQLAEIRQLPQLVRSFFKAPSVAYITDDKWTHHAAARRFHLRVPDSRDGGATGTASIRQDEAERRECTEWSPAQTAAFPPPVSLKALVRNL